MAGITVAEKTIGATVSMGAATSYEPVIDIAPLIARADEALYQAKRDGRNRLHKAGDIGAGGQPRPATEVRPEPAIKPAAAPRKRHVRHAKPAVPA
jgi:hypothetical protein